MINIRNTVTAVVVLITLSASGAEAVADPYATSAKDGTISYGDKGPSGHAQVDVGLDRGGNPSAFGASGSRGGISGGVSVGDSGVTVSGRYTGGDTSVGVSATSGDADTSLSGVVTKDF